MGRMRIETNGITLHVRTIGQGPPLMLLHGFTGSLRSWEPFFPSWSRHYQLIAVDLIGHGESDAPEEAARYSMAHAAEDLAAVLDALGLPAAAVLGYSMGGRVALSFAMLKPERVSAVVLESSSPGLASPEERKARLRQDEALACRIEQEGIERFTAYWEDLPLFATLKEQPEEIQRRIRRIRLNQRPHGLANSLRGMGTGVQPSWWDRLDAFTKPALLIAGERDEKFMHIARRMNARMKNSTFIPVSGAGHMVHVEQSARFDTIVREYLLQV